MYIPQKQIGNFNPLAVRNDLGELWENYIITERRKRQEYLRSSTNSYFYRTYDKKDLRYKVSGEDSEERTNLRGTSGSLSGSSYRWSEIE